MSDVIELDAHKKVFFGCIKDGVVWYKTDKGFVFPIKVEDLNPNKSYNPVDDVKDYKRFIDEHIVRLKQ